MPVDEYVKPKTNKKYIYQFISYQGCGCGFSSGDDYDKSDKEDLVQLERNINDLKKLFEYLEAMKVNDTNLKIYTC